MKLSYDVPTPLDYFASLVQSDGNFALFEAAVSLAQDEYPELDVQAVLGEVDTLLERMRRRLPADAGGLLEGGGAGQDIAVCHLCQPASHARGHG